MSDQTFRRTRGPREQLERATAEALANLHYGPPATELEATERAHTYQRLLTVLTPYTDDTLHRLTNMAPTSIGVDLAYIIVSTQPHEKSLNDWITVRPFVFAEESATIPIINGLSTYKAIAPYHDGYYPARREEQVRAIARVTAHFAYTGVGIDYDVNTHDFNMAYIEDEKLRELITTHETPGTVADLIIERNITSAEQFPELLDTMSTTPNALTEGVI